MANTSIKILVVDDLQDNLIALNALIKDAFPEAITLNAQSGKKGLELAAKEYPDVILLDILMPGMDGYEVCQKLKTDKELCNIPVIFVTATENTEEALVKALESGGESFLSKPIDEIELTAQVRAMLKIKEANDAKKNEKVRLEILVKERNKELVQELEARKQAEDKLKASETRFRFMTENSIDCIWQMDLKLGFTYISPSVKSMFGYTQKEWIGTSLASHATRREYIKMAREALIGIKSYNTFKQVTFEAEMLHKDGSTIPIEVNGKLIKNKKGFPIGLQGTTRDITERKQAEEALRESEAVQSKMVANIGDVIVIIDDKSLNRYKSPNIEKLFGWKPEELVGQSTWDNIHPDDLEHGKSFFGSLLEEPNKTGTAELRFKRKDGSYCYIEITAVNLFNDPDISGILGNYHDITERKQAEQELIAAKVKAEESDRLKSAFLANMSHEIRTPMNGILGFAELLKKPNLSSKKHQEYLEIMGQSGKRMLDTINSIVDISKIEAGLEGQYIAELNLNEQIEFLHEFFKPMAESKGLQLSINMGLQSNVVNIRTDKQKVISILTNLVNNALKFTKGGSVEFGYEKKGEYLEFYVKDTGIGIPKDRQDAIFERFIKADIDDKQAFQGSGLGLAIAKYYVEMLGGKIWVESETGNLPAGRQGGTTFYFTLPLTLESKDKAIITQADSSKDEEVKMNPEISGLKILVAEDDEASLSLLTDTLDEISSEILHAITGKEAVDACYNNPDIDLVLMDIRMPEMGGYEATAKIRQFNKDVIIIAQTAYGLAGDREKAIEAGCNDYVSKPIDINILTELIQSIVINKN